MSDSLIGDDITALDALMIQARTNNGLDGITGLLWTDGKRFAQVLEGGSSAIDALLAKIRVDPRHRNFQMVRDEMVGERQFGEWSMARPATDSLARTYQQRMLRHLSRFTDRSSATFADIVAGSTTATAA